MIKERTLSFIFLIIWNLFPFIVRLFLRNPFQALLPKKRKRSTNAFLLETEFRGCRGGRLHRREYFCSLRIVIIFLYNDLSRHLQIVYKTSINTFLRDLPVSAKIENAGLRHDPFPPKLKKVQFPSPPNANLPVDRLVGPRGIILTKRL